MDRTRSDPRQEDTIVGDAHDADDDEQDRRKILLALEEQVRIHEATLNAWRQRRDHILLEHERVLQRKRVLLQQRVRLRDRQQSLRAATGQHESLQRNLQESLAKSRERLQRLTRLEAMDEESFEDGDGVESNIEPTSDTCDDQDDYHGGDRQSSNGKAQEPTPIMPQNVQAIDETSNSGSNPFGAPKHNVCSSDPKHVSEPMWNNWFRKTDNGSVADVSAIGLPLLPPLEAKQVGEYIALSIREANALDRDDDLGRSLRRNLLDKTCLDVRALMRDGAGASCITHVSQLNKEKIDENATLDESDITSAPISASSDHLNPNLSLCPYELAGVCADDFCPYQHTTKATKILARERLPLPPLSSFILTGEENQSSQVVTETKPSNEIRSDNALTKNTVSPWIAGGGQVSCENGDDAELSFMKLPLVDDTIEEDDPQSDMLSSSSIEAQEEDDEKDEDESSVEAPFLTNKPHQIHADSFSFSGNFPKPDSVPNATEKLSNEKEFSSRSLPAILRSTYGVIVTDDRVEIKVEPVINDVSSPIPPFDHEILGRLMDASRLALHGGRFDIAITLCQVIREGDVLGIDYEKTRFRSYIDSFEARIRDSWDCGYNLRALFAAQVSMAIQCWSLADVREHFSYFNANQESILALVAGTCTECQRLMRNVAPSNYTSSIKSSLQGLLWRGRFDDADENLASDETCAVNNNISSTNDKLLDIQDIIAWSQQLFSLGPFDSLPASEQRLEERLNALWLEIKKTLEATPRNDKSNQKQDREFRGLKATIVIGHAIFGVLGSFVRTAGENEEYIENTRLSGSAQAAWTLLDGVIFQILKEFRRAVSGISLLDLLLVPLFSASIASAVFLRNYSTAQHRLEVCLSGFHRTPKHSSLSARGGSLLQLSELLWSQMIQLRMTLPTRPISGNYRAASSSKMENSTMPFESSSFVQNEKELIICKLKSLGIRLHNLSLWGDGIPRALAMETLSGRNIFWDLLFVSPDEKAARSNDFHTRLTWKTDFLERLDALSIGSWEIQGRRTSPVPLSPLPLLILHVGHHLTHLDLSQSNLECLPVSFGLYFPNLEILDLSCNKLTTLPESFQCMTCRMPQLTIFRAHHNRFKTLPYDIFSTMDGILSSPQSPSGDSLSPLKILDLSHNRLFTLPPLIGATLSRLEELFLDHNALTKITIVDLSRLVTNLPSLRLLTYKTQQTESDG